jgi:hypothetical protein
VYMYGGGEVYVLVRVSVSVCMGVYVWVHGGIK